MNPPSPIHERLQTDPTGGLSNLTLLIISLNGLTVIFIALIILCHRAPAHDDHVLLGQEADGNLPYEQALQDADVSLLNRAQRRARAKLLMKKSRRLDPSAAGTAVGAANIAPGADPIVRRPGQEMEERVVVDPLEENEIINRQGVENVHVRTRRVISSRRERQKAAKEIERMERAANMEQIRIHQKEREEMEKEMKQRLQMEKRNRMEREREEMIKEKYRHWKYMFPETDLDVRITVKEFLQELETNPVVCLEETAEEFQVSVDDLVRRLRELEEDGRIPHGIWNRPRGEYMYIGTTTMKHIANFIKNQGAVTLNDLKREILKQIHDNSNDHDNTGEDQEDFVHDLHKKKNQ